MSHRIVHIATRADWQRAQAAGQYRTSSLDREGYIHFSTPWQVPRVAALRFAGRDDLVALVVDPERLDVPLRYENCEGGIEPFPHVYGPVPLAAVTEHFPLLWDAGSRAHRFPESWRPPA